MASKYRLRLGDRDYEVEVEEEAGAYRLRLDDRWYPVSLQRIGESARYSLILDNHPYDVFAEESPHGFQIVLGSRTISVTSQRGRGPGPGGGPASLDAPSDGEWVLTSPMAAVVQQIMVKPDDEVPAGAVLMVVEAMKMQNELRARRGGQVKAVYVTVGQRVEQGTPLLVLV